MPSWALSRLAGASVLMAALGIGSGGPAALACGLDCRGYGYHPGPVYYAPPVYAYAAPVAVYAAPPVYAYAYYGPPYDSYPPVYLANFYTTRINIFRGPRWGYAAAYYNPRGRGGCGRRVRVCGHRAYLSGPIVRGVRVWRRW
jgi:hypothetical protein